MKVKDLSFYYFGDRGDALYADTGFGTSYFLIKDFHKGKVKVRMTTSAQYEWFDGFEQAKEWCQKDFNERVNSCLIKTYNL